uniref:Uncharacterized protein n=1 Tax=Anguilla anguilla TaxID=7936 RepID=A0A0E9RA01_ANGAN
MQFCFQLCGFSVYIEEKGVFLFLELEIWLCLILVKKAS